MRQLIIISTIFALIGCGGSSFGPGSTVGPYLHGPCPPMDDPSYDDYCDDWNECFERDDRHNPDLETIRDYCSTCHVIY